MLPVSLTIKGINSYRNETHFDFENLAKSGLFGVFGKVGSGKSTIIDAISLALYDRIEKLNSKDKRAYNLMNLQSSELYIEFVFRAGDELKNTYRFTVSGKREKKFDQVKTLKRDAYKLIDDEWIPDKSLKAEELLQLSYENFKRTIIIPQGQFRDFLELSETDRTKALKEIFNLHKFEFYQETVELEKACITKLNILSGNLEQLETYNESLLSEVENSLSETSNIVESKQLDHKHISEKLTELDKIKEQYNLIKSLNERKEKIDFEKSNILFLEQELNDFELCTEQFKSSFDEESKLQDEKVEAEMEFEKLQKILSKTEIELQTFTLKNKELKNKNNNNIEEEIIERERISSANKIEKQNELLEKKLSAFDNERQELNNNIGTYEQKENELEQEIRTINDSAEELNKILIFEKWLLEEKNLKLTKEENEQNIKELENELKNDANSKQTFIDSSEIPDVFKLQLHQSKLKASIKLINEENSTSVKSVELLLKQKESLIKHQSLFEYSEELKDGLPCPLCGSEHHPEKLDIQNSQKEIEQLNSKIEFYQMQSKALAKLENDLSNLGNNAMRKNEALKKWRSKNNDINEALEQHNSKKPPIELEGQELEAQKALITQQNERKKELELTLKQVQHSCKTLVDKLQKSEKEHQAIKEQKLLNDGQIKTLVAELKLLKYESNKHDDQESIINSLRKEQKIQEEINEKITSTERSIFELNAQIKPIKERLEKLNKNLKVLQKNKLELIQSSAFENEEKIKEILNKKIDLKEQREIINNFKIEEKTVSEQLEKLSKKVSTLEFSNETYNELTKDKNALETELKTLNQQLGAFKIQVDGIKLKLKEKASLLSEQSTLTARADNIKVLKSMFYKSGFVNYISTIFLRDLCAAANERFLPLTRNQLSIDIDDKNQFIIRDHLNGGRTRLAKTLSGGQKFQASLSLALSLSERVSRRQYQPKHFFFIDEGFGSLDQDSLHQVYETLRSLSKENKIIGVISHMESLQENITNFIHVKNTEDKGSHIEINI